MSSHTKSDDPPAVDAAHGRSVRPVVVLAALGVVFGDIGTSPIYTVQTVFSPDDPHPVPLNEQNLYGVVSLIFWSIMVIVTLTYVSLVMRADNDGEGGIMALITLLRRWGSQTHHRTALILAALGVFGSIAVLRRQHDHPGDIRAFRDRGHRGRRPGIRTMGRARSPRASSSCSSTSSGTAPPSSGGRSDR